MGEAIEKRGLDEGSARAETTVVRWLVARDPLVDDDKLMMIKGINISYDH